jgi:hypothetical protein
MHRCGKAEHDPDPGEARGSAIRRKLMGERRHSNSFDLRKMDLRPPDGKDAIALSPLIFS